MRLHCVRFARPSPLKLVINAWNARTSSSRNFWSLEVYGPSASSQPVSLSSEGEMVRPAFADSSQGSRVVGGTTVKRALAQAKQRWGRARTTPWGSRCSQRRTVACSPCLQINVWATGSMRSAARSQSWAVNAYCTASAMLFCLAYH